MNSDVVSRVLSGKAEKKLFVDSDNNGSIDTIYFIDNDERHTDKRQPLLVKIVDEDGDMDAMRDGDVDSDLWVADWYGDGSVDRIVDYADLDGDNDVDEQYLYQWTENKSLLKQMSVTETNRGYIVAWAKDYGDDNRLWYHTNYEYGQSITQWKTDFNGDEMFVYVFFYDREHDKLAPVWENAFSFYDTDGDSCSEEVVRFSGTGAVSEDVRYSMDIDNDNGGSVRHDFDFSLTGLGPIAFGIENCRTVSIRGHVTEPIMRWEDMRQVAKAGPWVKAHLTWDENDNNIDPRPGQIHNERWEGVINHVSEFMVQVGGPSCGPTNKRNEVDQDGSGALKMYASPFDRRLHLFGAEIGWIDVDYNFDDAVDMKVWMDDSDGDGFFDIWKYDCDADGSYERTVVVAEDKQSLLPFEYSDLQKLFNPLLAEAEQLNSRLNSALKTALNILEKSSPTDIVEEYFLKTLAEFDSEFGTGVKIKGSVEGKRYYTDIIRERYWLRFLKASSDAAVDITKIQTVYDAGDYGAAALLIEKKFQ